MSSWANADAEAGKPSWLQETGTDTNNSPAVAAASPTPSPALNGMEDEEEEYPGGGRGRRWGPTIALGMVSTLFLVLFVYAAVVNTNDGEGFRVMWICFYALHAILSGLTIVHRVGCSCAALGTLLPSVATFLVVWSTALMILASVQASRTDSGGPEEGGDIDGRDEKEEHIFEAAGAGLGLLSALFHLLVVKYLGEQKTSNE